MYCNFTIISARKCVCVIEEGMEHLGPSSGSAESNCEMRVTWPYWTSASIFVGPISI